MSIAVFLIPSLSLIFGIAVLICKAMRKELVISLKDCIINLSSSNFFYTSLILFVITFAARSYCLSLSGNTPLLNIFLFIIQTMFIIHYTIIVNISTPNDFED